jgi:hypothetical protein
MEPNPLPPRATAVTGDRHIDRAGGIRRLSGRANRQHPPQTSGASVAEDRACPTGEDSRHPSPFTADVGVAHGVHTAMNAVQATGGNSVPDCACGEPDPAQLSGRDDSVLRGGDAGEC